MRTACLIVLVSIASSICYPSKPLNERSTELAWQAWLLVDQGNRQGDLSLARRKITPKSVFIAPTFTPPACADGYKSDSMGRCVKIIKISESSHMDFLLTRLKEKFPIPEPTEKASTQGPLQFNIPLVDDEEMLQVNETKVAIVLAPSALRPPPTSVQVDVKRSGGDKFDVEEVAAILRVNPENVEMTTIAELTSTTQIDGETTTLQTSTMETTTTEAGETSTLPLEGDAIFFQVKI